MRILVADDDRITVLLLARLLKTLGHEVHTCFDGADVMEHVERLQPEVLLLDISMPGMSGFDVADELRHNPDLRPPCVIAVTGHSSPDDRRATAEAGFDAHVVKPVTREMLRDALAACPIGG